MPGRTSIAVLAIVLILMFFSANSYFAAADKSATVDEPGTVVAAWAQIHLGDFRDDCENPPPWHWLVGAGLPRALFAIDPEGADWQSLLQTADAQGHLGTRALYGTPGLDADALLRSIRLRTIGVAVILGVVIAWWAWRLGGPLAAVFAIVFYGFDPTILANSSQIKNDLFVTLALALAMACVWRFGQRASLPALMALILAASLAFLTKFSGLLAVPVICGALLARSGMKRPWPAGSRVARGFGARIAVSLGVIVLVLVGLWLSTWAVYGFRFLPSETSPDRYDFQAALRFYSDHDALLQSTNPLAISPSDIAKFRAAWRPPISVRMILWADAHRLLPESCLIGMLRLAASSQSRGSYLLGQFSFSGWWYYFPLAFLFKTPISTLLALVGAGAFLIGSVRRRGVSNFWTVFVFLLFPALYLAIAMRSNVNVGIRHLLPIYPFLFIAIGVAGATAWNSGRRLARYAVALLIVSLVGESASAFPNYIPFFNVACSGSRGGIRLLSESNLDMGQDLPSLARWHSIHADRPILLIYFGSADPRYYGIRYVNLPGSLAPQDLPAPGPGDPVYAVSASALVTPTADVFQHQAPLDVLNGTIYLFDAR